MFKKSNLFLVVLIFVFAGVVSTFALAEDDLEGSKDHPMISRYEGAYIRGYEHYDYDRLTFYTGEEDGELQELVPEGEATRILYFLPSEGLSVLQVQRNYQQALKDAGFEMVYEYSGGIDEIPYDIYADFDNIEGDHSKNVLSGKDKSYFLARLPQEDGDVYVSAHTWKSDYADAEWQPVTALQILEEKPMETGKIEVDTSAMAEDVDEKGSAGSSDYTREDIKGSEDHPMISRYEGSYIRGYEHYDYDRLTFYTGEENGELQELVLEGEATRILYFLPSEGLSVLQVQRNYQQALKDAGFEMVYEYSGGIDEIPYDIYANFDNIEGDHSKNVLIGKDKSYFLARLPQEDGDVYVSAHTWKSDYADAEWQPVTALQILEEKPMETGNIQVDINAETMAKDIDEKGSVRIYGIHFDTDKATIKEKSESTLAEIAALLEEKSDLRLGVVGHTDAVGSIEYNMNLSRRRAEAVVEFLASEHGISKDRLKPRGLGPWAPIASNEDEDGRARNRRVELIKMLEQ